MRIAGLLRPLGVLAVVAGCGDDVSSLPPLGDGALRLKFEEIALDSDAPLAITELAFVPGTPDLLVLSKSRTVSHYRLDSETATASLVGTFDVPGVDETADCGLISIAFDPAFATNHLVYFAACESPKFSRITRHVLDLDHPESLSATLASTTGVIMRVGSDDAKVAWHNVGKIGFTPDGYMWALFGEKNLGAAGSQDPAEDLGSVVRIAPHREGDGYDPAPGNPFAGVAGKSPDVVAYGLRSPWRGAVDEVGRLWIGDVGDSAYEEVNVTRFAGENFGAGLVEGPCTTACAGLTDPVAYWDRSNDSRYPREDPDVVPTSRRVVWVGLEYPRTTPIDRYDGRAFGKMLAGDFAGGWIRGLSLDAGGALVSDEPVGHLFAATSWDVGPDGYIYAASYGSQLAFPYVHGAVYRAVLAR